MKPPNSSLRPATLCIHAGTYHDEQTGGACSPIFPSTACAFPNEANENFYPRYFNTPNQQVIEQKVAALEKGEAALVLASGMAAITTLLLSFELRDAEQVANLMKAFRLVMPALSLGGVESLVCIPSRTSHRKLSRQERQRAGIGDGLVRLSVGIEDIEDLIEDLTHALDCAGGC
jgi:cystathionine beta-lyase/cystathionine gamma-synthase